MVGLCVPFPARGGCFGVGRSETFQTLSLLALDAGGARRLATPGTCRYLENVAEIYKIYNLW